MIPDTLLNKAIELGLSSWSVFPLRPAGKEPAIAQIHPQGTVERATCKGRCGHLGHGLYDASTNPDRIAYMWKGRPHSNIGIALPQHVMVIDTDPRNGGDASLEALEDRYGELPVTLTAASGRGDGGLHRYYSRPSGRITDKLLGAGVDLKHDGGYVVAPPSIHPDSGQPYSWLIEAPVADPPAWLVELIRVAPAPVRTYAPKPITGFGHGFGSSIADTFSTSTSWSDVLVPHGWRCIGPDPDADGAVWLHPTATSSCSATVRNGCLFVYSTNTPFDTSAAGDPNGYTRFRAYAVLDFQGDMSAAAKQLASLQEAA